MIILIDTREQTPFVFPDSMKTSAATLPTGDYTIKGLERYITVERKSLPDLMQSISRDRERFEKELHRMQGYKKRAVIIEAEYRDIVTGQYKSKMSVVAAVATLGAFQQRYNVPFCFCGNYGAVFCASLLKGFYKDIQKLKELD